MDKSRSNSADTLDNLTPNDTSNEDSNVNKKKLNAKKIKERKSKNNP